MCWKFISSMVTTNHCKLQKLITTDSLFLFSHYQSESKWHGIYTLVLSHEFYRRKLRAQLWRQEFSIKRTTGPKPLMKEALFHTVSILFFFTTQKTGYSGRQKPVLNTWSQTIYSLEKKKPATPKVAGGIGYPEGRVADHHVH